MTRRIKELTGVPIVTLTYDGTSDRMNDAIVPYIKNAMADNRKLVSSKVYLGSLAGEYVITSYSIHYTKLYD